LSPDILESYRILELRPGASADEIRESYFDLVKIWHPDRLQDEHPRLRHKAEEKLKQLNVAYGHLLDHVSAASSEAPVIVSPPDTDPKIAAQIRPRYFGGLWGYVDAKGKLAIPPKFLYAEAFRSALACVKADTQGFGFISSRGDFVIQPRFERAHGFFNGLAAVRMNHKWGYIDLTGAYAIYPVFDDARNFHQHLAAVKVDGTWGFVTKAGEFAIPPRFEQADDFRGGCAWVRMPGTRQRFKIDVNGDLSEK
jgi:hypothetical protein